MNLVDSLYGRLIRATIPYQGLKNERLAVEELCRSRLKANQIAVLISAIVIIVGVFADMLYYRDQLYEFGLLRGAALIVLLFCWVIQMPWNNKRWQMIWLNVFLIASSISLIVAGMIFLTDGIKSPYFGGMILVMIGMAFVARVAPLEIALYSLYVIAQYLLASYANHIDLFGLPANSTGQTTDDSFLAMLLASPEHTAGLFFIVLSAALAYTGAKLGTSETYRRILQELKTSDAQSDLKDFVIMVTHEIKTPIQYLKTFSQYLAKRHPEHDTEVDVVKHGIELQSSRLVDQLRKLVSISSADHRSSHGKGFDHQADLQTVLCDLCAEARAACLIKRIRFTCVGIPDGKRIRVPVSRSELETVIGNIITNAIKFTPANESVVVELTEDQECGTVMVSVKDTGEGMTPDTLENLFVAFRQGDDAMSREMSGMGLGMYVVKSIVDEVGGTVAAQSNRGVGTTVTITLPATFGPGDLMDGQNDNNGKTTGIISAEISESEQIKRYHYPATSVPEGASSGKVLLVDDESSIHQSFSEILKEYEITHAVDGAECLEAIKRQPFDVVILDVMLPKEDGINTLRKIRDIDHQIPILISSALLDYGQKSLIEHAIESGAQDVIHKPVDSIELTMRVKSLVNSSRIYRQLTDIQSHIVQTEKLSSLFFMANGLLHNLGNPLYQALMTITALREKTAKPEHEVYWTDVEHSLRMSMRVVSDLKRYSHPNSRKFEDVRVSSAITQALSVAGIPESRIKRSGYDVVIRSVYSDLLQIIITFLSNAYHAIQALDDGQIVVNVTRDTRGAVRIDITDNGPGVSCEKSLFEPHYTTKPAGQGTGLGLYVASILAANLGYQIGHERPEPQGACFYILIPDACED